MEFNVSLPCGANASIAPVSTLTVTQRWAKVVNVSTTGTEYVQVTKFDVIHNIQYTDCKGNVRVSTESTSTIMETAATSETITTLTPTVTQAINKYAKDLASNLFHFNSVASQAVITYVVKNMEDKYGKYLDIFTDVHGNINLELLANAVKAEMKEKSADGFVVNILNKPVRFGEDDVNQLVEIFKTFKQNN